jgi:hypothetical protein
MHMYWDRLGHCDRILKLLVKNSHILVQLRINLLAGEGSELWHRFEIIVATLLRFGSLHHLRLLVLLELLRDDC